MIVYTKDNDNIDVFDSDMLNNKLNDLFERYFKIDFKDLKGVSWSNGNREMSASINDNTVCSSTYSKDFLYLDCEEMDNLSVFHGEKKFKIINSPYSYNYKEAYFLRNGIDDIFGYYKHKSFNSIPIDMPLVELENNLCRVNDFSKIMRNWDTYLIVNAPKVDDILSKCCDLKNVKYVFPIKSYYLGKYYVMYYWVVFDDNKIGALYLDDDIFSFTSIERTIDEGNNDRYLSYNIFSKCFQIKGDRLLEIINASYIAYYSKAFMDINVSLGFHQLIKDLCNYNAK